MNFKLQDIVIIILEFYNCPPFNSLAYMSLHREMVGRNVRLDIGNDVVDVLLHLGSNILPNINLVSVFIQTYKVPTEYRF